MGEMVRAIGKGVPQVVMGEWDRGPRRFRPYERTEKRWKSLSRPRPVSPNQP